jgi:hypothetical protein
VQLFDDRLAANERRNQVQAIGERVLNARRVLRLGIVLRSSSG